MISKERNIAINLVKAWAADHQRDWIIADTSEGSNNSLEKTGDNLIKVLNQERDLRLNLVDLVSRIENILANKISFERVDGCRCIKCSEFVDFALPNQPNETFICFECRSR